MQQSQSPPPARGTLWNKALSQTLPITLGYVPVGMAYGVLAGKAGLSAVNVLLMSVLVYAGSAQLVAVGLFAAGASGAAIVATTVAVNLRHVLFSAAMAPLLSGWRKRELAAFAFELTDESFALHAARFGRGDRGKELTLSINVLAQASWVAGTALGVALGDVLGDGRAFALDFALPGMFLALLAGQVGSRSQVAAAVVGAGLSLAACGLGITGFGALAAGLAGAGCGLGVEKWMTRRHL
ncbi:branched-chain amino acid ABC transporter permease [Desulfovibrio aerotolerans]|uniref:Branched-chain amino acid ABC transporter permease n=1 Tax=Solidesulfovibrio aerotolerans TaxID=295255 RepID=A0A7C9J952_9BACT|nr:AzlC family ABC transporter permease [Solidesulfovibrio aerotolerans]MYL83278.1 branched-chain amino acid ABC transporter permease [Solidesulfovibrio aerotolerans]